MFDLVNEGPATNVARDKDRMLGEAVWQEHMRSTEHLGQSPTFKLFHQAILDRKQVTCTFRGLRREVCPYILGHKDGEERALVFQFGGSSSGGLPPGGGWKCLALSEVREAEGREGSWHGAVEHRKTQRCVDDVYIDVNTDVPNQPGRG